MITRKNYEEYFLDYFDGNLSDEMVERLLHFLAANPDLEEEFYLLMEQTGEFKITKEDFSPITIKRNPKIGYELSSFDYLCVAELEKDITPSEKIILDGSIATNAKLKADFDIFQKTKLAVEKVECPFKDKLKKNVFKSKFKSNLITYSSIAAAVLIVFYFTINEEKVKELSTNIQPGITATPERANGETGRIIDEPQATGQLAEQHISEYNNKINIGNNNVNNDINSTSTKKDTIGISREQIHIDHIQPTNLTMVEQKDIDLTNHIVKSSQVSLYQNIESNNNSSEIATNLTAFLEKAKMESETISQQIKDIKGRRKGVFIARAINGLNSIFGTNVQYSSKYDAEGNLMAVNLEAGYLKYSKKYDEDK